MAIIKLNYLSFTNHYQSFDFMQQHKQCTDYIYHAFIVEWFIFLESILKFICKMLVKL